MPRSHSGQGAATVMANEVERPRILVHRSLTQKQHETMVTRLKVKNFIILWDHSMTPAQGFMRFERYLYEFIVICGQFSTKLLRTWRCMET